MPTEELYRGTQFVVRAWIENGVCPVMQFLEELNRNGNSDAKRLFNLITRVADNGMTHNKQHVRSLEDGILEFKAPNTARILFFYDCIKGTLIICTHGFTGKRGAGNKNIPREIEKAKKIREDYLSQEGRNQ